MSAGYLLQEEQSALLASFSNCRVCRAFAVTPLTLALRLCAPDSCCATGYDSMHTRLCTVLSAQAAFAVGPSGVLMITFGLLNCMSSTLRGCMGRLVLLVSSNSAV